MAQPDFEIKERLIQLREMLEDTPEFYTEKKKELAYFTSNALWKEAFQPRTAEVLLYSGFFCLGIIAYFASPANQLMWGIIVGGGIPLCIWLGCLGMLHARIGQLKKWRIETRLQDLDELRKCDLVTEEEYTTIREKLLTMEDPS